MQTSESSPNISITSGVRKPDHADIRIHGYLTPKAFAVMMKLARKWGIKRICALYDVRPEFVLRVRKELEFKGR